jgi:hypothetical protein
MRTNTPTATATIPPSLTPTPTTTATGPPSPTATPGPPGVCSCPFANGTSGRLPNAIFGLGAANPFSVLELGTSAVAINGSPGGVIGDVGIAANGSLSLTGSQLITGTVSLASAATFMNNSSSTPPAVVNNANLSAAISDAQNAQSTLATLTCTQRFGTLQGTQTIQATQSGRNVLCVQSVALEAGEVITLSAGAFSDVSFVLNVSRQFKLNGGAQIVTDGNVTPSDVLYNVVGKGDPVALTGNSSVDGTLLATARTISLTPGFVHDGAVISGMAIDITGDGKVACPLVCPPVTISGTVSKPGPHGNGGPHGLVPAVGITVEAFLCEHKDTCLATPGSAIGSAVTDAAGAFVILASMTDVEQVAGRLVLLSTTIDGVKIRDVVTLDKLKVATAAASVAGATGHAAQLQGAITVDPNSEAVVQLLAMQGLQSFSDAGIDAVSEAVEAANAATTFEGLSVEQANTLATTTATNDSTVQMTLQDNQFTPTPTATPIRCVGDCDGNGSVSIDELLQGVTIALDSLPLSACPQFDVDDSGTVTVNELTIAINNTLGSCTP